MPKKWAEDTRGAKAKAQKAAAQAEKDAVRRREAEDAESAAWARGANTRKQGREEADEAKRRERERREAEKKALRDAEAAEYVKVRKSDKSKGFGTPKSASKSKKSKKASAEAAMWALGLGPLQTKKTKSTSSGKSKKKSKASKDDDMCAAPAGLARAASAPAGSAPEPVQTISVSGLDAALAAMSSHAMGVSVEAATAAREGDKHPERRRKAAYRAFEEREMDRIRAEEPGLKRSQIRDRIFKLWQRSPENPMNQAKAAASGGAAEGGHAGSDEVWKSASGPIKMKRGASGGGR